MSRPIAQVHRFGDKVALYTHGNPTVYLTPQHAQQIAKALQVCTAEIIGGVPFSNSKVGTVYIEED